jgi:hypothetical protein
MTMPPSDTRSSANPVIRALSAWCTRWFGELVVLPNLDTFYRLFNDERDNDPYEEAPFARYHGVCWNTRTVYTVESFCNVNAIVHEMGHVFACTEPPRLSDEWAFLGWEACLARIVRGYTAWSEGNANYGVVSWGLDTPDGEEWGFLDRTHQRSLLRNRIAAGITAGILTSTHRPRCVR